MRSKSCLLLFALSLLPTHIVVMAAEGAGAPANSATVTTAEGEQLAGPVVGLADGKLTIGTEPPRTYDLADLELVELGHSPPAPAGPNGLEWIGQDNHDVAQVGAATGGNGIQDIHLRALNLERKKVLQVLIVCRMPKQVRAWRLDTSNSPHWRLALERSESAPQADLYLEPPTDDCFGIKFEATFTYEDGSTSKAEVTATTHTSDQAKVNAAAKPGENTGATQKPSAEPAADNSQAFLAGGGRLQGNLIGLTADSLKLRSAWGGDLDLPTLHLGGVWLGNKDVAGSRADFDKQLSAPAAEDTVFLLAPDGTKAQISGSVQGLTDQQLSVRFKDENRSIKKERVLGVVFAERPKLPPILDTHQLFTFASGDSIAGHWRGLKDGTCDVETIWHAHVPVPMGSLAEIRTRNGKLAYLSDIEPSAVEEVPYFGRVIHWGANQGFEGNPPSFKGKKPGHSIAMHSRSRLTFALDEQFAAFKTTLGFDDSSAKRGRVSCRVILDGRELFSEKDLRADQDVRELELALDGGKELTLEVDFGENDDIGDRVMWVEPRLIRRTAK
jgi:hypothetical protein